MSCTRLKDKRFVRWSGPIVGLAVVTVLALGGTAPSAARAAELWVGAATVDITPERPVALSGQRRVRISKEAETPITATVLALESRDGENSLEQAVMVSCDVVAIRSGILDKVREKVKTRMPDFDLQKLFLSATHTHTAPVMLEGRYTLPETGVMQPGEYAEWMTGRVAEAVAEVWRKRAPGKVAWGQDHAVVGRNRRAVYEDGTAKMYGSTNTPDFRGIEGYEDHSVDVLFFWDEQDRLIATAINVACPAQEVEGRSAINADYWHPVRESLRAKYGEHLAVLGWIGAAGDQSPHLMFDKAAEALMCERRGLTRLEEIARRIVRAWEDVHEVARKDTRSEAVLRHQVQEIDLPYREVTEAEVAECRKQAAQYADDPAQKWNYRWNQAVVERYERQQAGKPEIHEMELHALRLGDVAIATNEFELFTDYGIQMKSRSPAVQTFVIQLTGSAGYLPTRRAVRGGGYSAVIQSSRVGPKGGQRLVDRTVESVRALWPQRQ
ncbi:MAG: hypothetical protein R6U98_30260 [Pirellulaceae bacterium]